MNRSVLTALLLAVAAVAWIGSGIMFPTSPPAQQRLVGAPTPQNTAPAPAVRVVSASARPYLAELVINGRTEATRRVTLRGQTEGRVASVVAGKGAALAQGDVILTLEIDDRQARMAEARATLALRQTEYNASETLAERGFRAETARSQAQAQLEAARAAVETLRLDIERTTLRAPFDGILNDRPVEVGDFVRMGDTVATIVDLDPMIAVGQVSERDVADLAIGQTGTMRLPQGDTVTGVIRFISAAADPATRTFRIELEVPNPDHAIRDGVTAELRLPRREIMAHLVSPAVLTLAEDGVLGVKVVEDGTARFLPVRIVADAQDGIWLAGLPPTVELIVVGHEFVLDGQKVTPVYEDVPSGLAS